MTGIYLTGKLSQPQFEVVIDMPVTAEEACQHK